jgi:hypothetical protein
MGVPSFSFVFAVDPGITTGICYGICYHTPGASAADLIAGNAEGLTVEQVYNKDEVKAGVEIATLFNRLQAEMQQSKNPRCVNIALVIEDFILRGPIGSTAREGLSPVRVTAAIDTYCMLKKIQFDNKGLHKRIRQTPADAKRYATTPRLKDMGVNNVARGKPHGRDALRHWCVYVARHRAPLTML